MTEETQSSDSATEETTVDDVITEETQTNNTTAEENQVEDVQSEDTDDSMTEDEQNAVEDVIRKLTLKVDGEEIEEELPFDATPEMIDYLQKKLQLAAVSSKRMQESAELKKSEIERNAELEDFMKVLQNNPELILSQMGHDVKKFAEDILTKEVELMEMSDEERKILELQTELEKIQKQNEMNEKQAEDARLETLRNQYATEFEKDLTEAINSSTLPNNPEIITRMTGMMRVAVENDIDISFKDIVPLVQEELQSDLNSILSSMPDDVIRTLIGDERLSKVLPSKATPKKAPPTTASITDTSEKKEKSKTGYRKTNINDFFRNI